MSDWFLIIALWVLLYCYLIIASVDFGLSFFLGYNCVFKKDREMSRLIKHYLSPVWDITNILFLFLFIGLLSFLPHMTSLFEGGFVLPSILILLVLLIRSGGYAYVYYTGKDSYFIYVFYAITGLAIPAALASGLTISEGGYLVQSGTEWWLVYRELLTSFYFWAVLILSIISVLYISLMFMAYHAAKQGAHQVLETLKNYILLWSVPTILGSAIVFIGIQSHNPIHFSRILDLSWFFFCSLICLMVAITLVFQGRRFTTAFFFALLQFFFAFFGYGISHLPFVIYPDFVVHTHFYTSFTKNAIMLILIAVIALLIPILLLSLRYWIVNGKRTEAK